MNKKMLIIEDDPDIIDLLKIHLKDIEFSLDSARNGEQGLEKALKNDYELVILDLMLPGLDGLEVCRGIREKKKTLPILMLTAKAEEFDKVLGLELGADDYITKPFSIRELMARIKAVLRRISALRENGKNRQEDKELVFDQLSINLAKRKVILNNNSIDLTAKEFDLLVTFASNPGRAFTRENLLNTVWGYQFSGYDHTVNSHINRLRAKIEKDPSNPRYIKTVWGVGYKFAELEDLER